MSAESPSLARLLLKEEIQELLYREAELLDERRFEDWLDLFTEDARYWMPMRRNVPAEEPEREFTREGVDVNWFDEGKDTLTRRVKQIRTGVHWAEQPPSRICHMVSNVQLLGAPPTARRPPRSPSRAGFSSTATASRRRPTSWSASARTSSAAWTAPGASPGARSSSTRASCS